MSLSQPLALLGLLTLPAILLLHLLSNRRKQRTVPSLQLWRGLEQKKGGALPRTIPISLMLLLQLILAAVLTLAVARPTLSSLQVPPRQTIFILDTTTSMTATDASTILNTQGSSRFDVARQIIWEHLGRMVDHDTLAVIGLNQQPEILLAGDEQKEAQMRSALDHLVPGATGIDLPAALTLANGLVDENKQNEIVVLTDGHYILDSETLPPILAPLRWEIVSSPSGTQDANQALLNVSARTLPDGDHRLFARVVNYAETPVVRTLRVSTDGRVFDETVVEIAPGDEIARVWTLPAQTDTATVEIVEPDVLPLDNRAELPVGRRASYRVLLVSDMPDILSRALEAQPGVELTIAPATDGLSESDAYDLLVLEDPPLALTAWPAGNLLVVDPPLGHPLLPANNFSRNLRPDSGTAASLLAGVDWSGVYFGRAPQVNLPDWAEADLLALSLGQALIFHGAVDETRLVVWAFDLAESNLPARLALPILTANTLASLLSPSLPPAVLAGEPVVLSGNLSVETPDGRRTSTLDTVITVGTEKGWDERVFSDTGQPGLYKIYDENDTPVASFAVHAGSALESNLTVQFQPATPSVPTSSAPVEASPQTNQLEIWPWLIGLVLVIAIAEGWLAWRA